MWGTDPKPCVVAGVLLSRQRMLYPPLPLLTSAPAPASQLGAGSGWAQSISAERDSAGGWQSLLGASVTGKQCQAVKMGIQFLLVISSEV